MDPESIQAPSEEPVVETEPTIEPVVPTEQEEPVVPPTEPAEPELFELPDGRKVDADTLTKEWKENFYPEYTRKSQELAQYKQATTPEVTTEPKEPWVPETYEEIIQKAKEEVIKTIEQTESQRIQEQQRIETEVATQLDGIKKTDPSLNENALFQHALKYKFTDLQLAYQNMKDMNLLIKNVQEKTAHDIKKRQDPVSITPNAGIGKPDPRNFSSATDFLRSITG